MATYCTDAQVTRWLPDNLPADFDSAAERLAYITEASAQLDAIIGPRFALNASFQKFPDVTDSPATPAVIQLPASLLAAALILLAMGALNLVTRDPKPLEDRAARTLDAIRNGVMHVTDSAGKEYGTMNVTTSTTKTYAPSFTEGGYDADGNLVSADAGSLDDLTT